jgi:hypothetical protein
MTCHLHHYETSRGEHSALPSNAISWQRPSSLVILNGLLLKKVDIAV